jgi:hypothetical protein
MDFCEWMKNVELICPSGRRDLRHQGRVHGRFHLISAGLSHRKLWFYAPVLTGSERFRECREHDTTILKKKEEEQP